MTRRFIASAALAGAVIATAPAAPANARCRPFECQVVREVCATVDCVPPFTDICFYADLVSFCV